MIHVETTKGVSIHSNGLLLFIKTIKRNRGRYLAAELIYDVFLSVRSQSKGHGLLNYLQGVQQNRLYLLHCTS